MADRPLEKLVLELLEPGVFKTTAQLAEEFRAEYAAQWRRLEEEGERLYGGGCGAYQQPSTRIAQVLFDLSEAGRCACRRLGREYTWSACGQGTDLQA